MGITNMIKPDYSEYTLNCETCTYTCVGNTPNTVRLAGVTHAYATGHPVHMYHTSREYIDTILYSQNLTTGTRNSKVNDRIVSVSSMVKQHTKNKSKKSSKQS